LSLLLSVLALSIGAVAWLVIELKKGGAEVAQLDAPTLTTTIPAIPAHMINTRARAMRAGKSLWLLAAGLFVGWLWRDHQLATATRYTYTDVTINRKINDHKFIVQPARMSPIISDICPESSVDWREREILRDWTFDQRPGCKHVISYHEKEI